MIARIRRLRVPCGRLACGGGRDLRIGTEWYRAFHSRATGCFCRPEPVLMDGLINAEEGWGEHCESFRGVSGVDGLDALKSAETFGRVEFPGPFYSGRILSMQS